MSTDIYGHRLGYSFALAEFHYGKHRPGEQASEEDMMFHARFSAPTLRFLCNHEALFQIDLVEGHFNLDYSRASDNATANRCCVVDLFV